MKQRFLQGQPHRVLDMAGNEPADRKTLRWREPQQFPTAVARTQLWQPDLAADAAETLTPQWHSAVTEQVFISSLFVARFGPNDWNLARRV